MTTPRYTLAKEERLSWKRYIDLLFAEGKSFIAFPLRVVYLTADAGPAVPVSMLVSVSKKKFKRAVKRNQVKRQVREAYRLRKPDLAEFLLAQDKKLLVAFLYVDKEIRSFEEMEKAMTKAIRLLREKV